ncbi:OmpP1/FadL family transporter [Sinimarinibacterium sp. NLF-5-8]|uniref:OmpP1/FadL family transporter n=1 Tax=Sinimarinibacterium sp. NLF-5-8 TaxID=2698684 RepID=UPI00137BBB8E|nr:outer membrane protein transport protein [Sinimarinibacterium sp. NLF-5-8]QHS10313.1 TonB-dependent receptor [Sinimarinibacterium sp. NLF-5-8]
MKRQLLLILCAGLMGLPAYASYGPYEHGYGIKSMGAGGIGFVQPEDGYAVNANPAAAAFLDHRLDLGLNWIVVQPGGSIEGNAAGDDQKYNSDGARHFPIPQAAYVRPLSERLSFASTLFAAGIGSDYRQNPYARFGADDTGGLSVTQSGLSAMLAWRLRQTQAIGAGINLSYRAFELKGAQPFTALSQAPERVTNQGSRGGLGISLSLGWQAQLSQTVSAGVGWRSTTYTEKIDRYAGVLPDQGRLNMPALWGGGLAFTPTPRLTLAVDYQRVEYASEPALGHPLARLTEHDQPLGADAGPGFGWRDQNIYKLGLIWRASERLTLRAGYSQGSVIMPPSQTLFGLLAQAVGKRHYTAGATYALTPQWEMTGYAAVQPRNEVRGQQSIPADFGGGEAHVFFTSYSAGLSISRRFGAPAASSAP